MTTISNLIQMVRAPKLNKLNPTPQSATLSVAVNPVPQPRPVLPQITDAQRREISRLMNFIDEEEKKIAKTLKEERSLINGCMELVLRIEAIKSNSRFVPINELTSATVPATVPATAPVPAPTVNVPVLAAPAIVPKKVTIVDTPSAMISSKQVNNALNAASANYKELFYKKIDGSAANTSFSELQELARIKPKTPVPPKNVGSSLPPVYNRDLTAKTSPLYLSTNLQLPASTVTAKGMRLIWTSHAPSPLEQSSEQSSPQQVPSTPFSMPSPQEPLREILWPSQSKKRDSEAMYESQDFSYISDSNDSQKTILVTDEDIDGAQVLIEFEKRTNAGTGWTVINIDEFDDLSEPAQERPKRKKQAISYEDIEESADYLDGMRAEKRSVGMKKKCQTFKRSGK